MTKFVSAAEANRHFSKLLREASAGERVVVTSRGRPVAQITRVEDDEASTRAGNFAELTSWLADRPVLDLPRVTRDEMYE